MFMFVCVLALFPVYNFFKPFFKWLLLLFGVCALIGFGIRMIWRVRDIKSFKDNVYMDMFERQEQERAEKKNNHEKEK